MIARSFCCLLLLVLAACEKPLRLPYIKSELHNWPTPYKGVSGLRLHVFNTGTVRIPSKFVYHDGSLLNTQSLDILVFAIEHPRQGLMLFGTGLNRRIATSPERHVGTLVSLLGNFAMLKEQDIVSQLTGAKLPIEKVHYLIMPDLRFDHAGEIEGFPTAQVVVTSSEHEVATGRGNKLLYRESEYDKIREWQFINFGGTMPLGTFQAHKDLFGDGSVLLIDVTGVTAGGVALLVRLPTMPVVLCGNLAWTQEQYFRVRQPGLLFNRGAWWETVWRLKKFKELVPELVVLPDHDWKAVEAVKSKDMVIHAFKKEGEKRKRGEK